MKSIRPSSKLSLLLITLILAVTGFLISPALPQTRERTVTPNRADANIKVADIIKTDVDLVTIDALVLQKNTARVVGGLKQEDFFLSEDGTRQTITHFSQDTLPLSVLLLIDRGGCLDPFGEEVRRAAKDALSQLKPTDEVAVMTYHDTAELRQGFTHDRILLERAINYVPPHDERANHCLNIAFDDAANYMMKAGNPSGRRVIVVVTGVTRNWDCRGGPSNKSVTHTVFESGSVVSAIIPRTPEQIAENGVMRWATRFGKLAGAPYIDIQKLADETGGEMLRDKPEDLDHTFNTLITHLRTRYNFSFVSTNKKRDGTVRKLKIDLADGLEKSQGRLVVKARRTYVAPKE
ncbi:MAG TPA: VWA domain-containing protein [Pyrinomonadaceae bacterium]|jgi:Ca-activated chloride channel homolog|nr:VWA domain-containing protein [Pyrinomonadaceae bacterium]